MQDKKFTNENFSKRFAALVAESPLSQKQLAEKLGLAESAIVNYKKGRTPKADELLRISRHFQAPMEWLLTGEGESSLQGAISEWKNGLMQSNPQLFDQDGNFRREKDLVHSVQMHDAEIAKNALANRADDAEKKLSSIKKKLAQILKDL